MSKRFLPYTKQSLDDRDITAVTKILKSDRLTQGPAVEIFEREVANYCAARYAVAVSSGSAGLLAAYMACGIKEGDEVITTPLTFVGTANMIVHCGARPVFVDIDPETLCIDPALVEQAITKRTKAIVAVDFAGHPADYTALKRIAREHNLALIDDAAHSFGTQYKGKPVGGLVDATVFSFHPAKCITTGEGGMVVTNKKRVADAVRKLRHHSIEKRPAKGGWYYEVDEPGYNFRVTDLQCALGSSQLKKADRFIKRRREIVAQYSGAFSDVEEIVVPTEYSYAITAWHIYPVQFRNDKLAADRKQLFEAFHKENIGVQVHYMPVHLHPFYKKTFGYKKGDFPNAEAYYECAITLPLFPAMTDSDVKRVISTTKKLLAKYSQ